MSTSRRPFRLKEQPSTTIMHCDRGIRAIQGQDQGYLGIIWIKINNCHFNLPGTVIELLDIECALCHVTGVQFDKQICPYKSAILDFLQKLPFAFLLTRDIGARILCLIFRILCLILLLQYDGADVTQGLSGNKCVYQIDVLDGKRGVALGRNTAKVNTFVHCCH